MSFTLHGGTGTKQRIPRLVAGNDCCCYILRLQIGASYAFLASSNDAYEFIRGVSSFTSAVKEKTTNSRFTREKVKSCLFFN